MKQFVAHGKGYSGDYDTFEEAQAIVTANGQGAVFVHASSRDAEIREVLEGLKAYQSECWCQPNGYSHSQACLAAQALYAKLHPVDKSDG